MDTSADLAALSDDSNADISGVNTPYLRCCIGYCWRHLDIRLYIKKSDTSRIKYPDWGSTWERPKRHHYRTTHLGCHYYTADERATRLACDEAGKMHAFRSRTSKSFERRTTLAIVGEFPHHNHHSFTSRV